MKISIALCTYNGSKYLKEQLDSLKNQTLQADEIIVCDDCSTDNTINILNQYINILNIKLFTNKSSLGSTKNFEKAISLCSGDIIFLCDQDDIWEKNKIEIMSKVLEDKNIGLCLCNGILIDENSKKIKDYTLWNAFKINKEQFNFNILVNKCVFTGMALAFKSSFKKYFLPISPNAFHDEWIGLICSYFSKVSFIENCLVRYRIHKGQQVGTYSVLSIIDLYKIVRSYTIINIEIELQKVKDIIKHFEKLKVDKTVIAKFKEKEKLYTCRTTRNIFRFFILLWQFIIGNYNLYTNGKYKTFIRDIFAKREVK